MKRYCLEFYCKNLYMHTHCYFDYNDKMYFQIHDLQGMFNNALDIVLISNVFQRRYSYMLKYFGSYIREGRRKFIERDSFLTFFPILFDFYTNVRGHDEISRKLLYFYTYLKNRMNYTIG